MGQSGTMRRSVTTIAKRSRSHRRFASLIVAVILAVLSWGLLALIWWAWLA